MFVRDESVSKSQCQQPIFRKFKVKGELCKASGLVDNYVRLLVTTCERFVLHRFPHYAPGSVAIAGSTTTAQMISNLEEDDEKRIKLSHSLSQSLDSLLGSKSTLTTEWVDSVRSIMKSAACGSPRNCPSYSFSQAATNSEFENGQGRQQSLDEQIAKLEGELVVLRTALGVSNSHRRGTLNRILDLKGNIRVFCRVRPFLPSEKQLRTGPLTTPGVDLLEIPSARKSFQFDRVFQPDSVQDDIFAEIEPIIRSALDGHNVCIFAYGQTGSGKTFTMEGSKDEPGVVPRTFQHLFEKASFDKSVKYSYSLSMLEVYKGSLRDLLVARPTRRYDVTKCLSIQMGSKGYIEVENLTEIPISDVKEASRLFFKGSKRRSTAWTNANDTSSRSHCERLLKTNAQGLTMEEGRAINVSLSALGNVISALRRRCPHVPYRNSKLTQILRDSLGENSKTLMLVHVSPKEIDLGETICSLTFATRVRGTHLGHELSAGAERENASAMSELQRQMDIYESECQLLYSKINSVLLLLNEKHNLVHVQGFSTPNQERVALAGNMSLSSLSPCDTSDKPETDCSTISPVRNIPRFMSPTASSRGKRSPGILNLVEQPIRTQQPPMTFSSRYSKRIGAPKGASESLRTRMKMDATNPKRKFIERSPWPTSIRNSVTLESNYMVASDRSVDRALNVEESSSPAKFRELPANMLSPAYHSRENGEHFSRILAAERSVSKLAVVMSSAHGSMPRSRRRLSLDCGSINNTMKRFAY